MADGWLIKREETIMKNNTQIRVASGVLATIGLWMMLLPLFTTIEGGALVSVVVSGMILIVSAGLQVMVKNSLPSIVSALVGLWLMTSVLVFSVSEVAAMNILIAGMLTFFASVWDGIEVAEVSDKRALTS